MSSEAEQLSSVIGRIFDAALDPELWPMALEAAANFAGGVASTIGSYDEPSQRANFDRTWNYDPELLRHYRANLLPHNPLIPTAMRPDVGEIVTLRESWSDQRFNESRVFKEMCQPQGWVDGAQVTLDKSLTGIAVMGVLRHAKQGVVDQVVRQRMQLLFPHLRRAVLVGRTIDLHKLEAGTLADVLDGLAAAVFLLDQKGRLISANVAGEAMLESGNPLRKSADSLSISSDHAADHALREALAAASAGDMSVDGCGISVPFGREGEDNHVAHVLPLGSGTRRKTALRYGAASAVFVRSAALGQAAALVAMGERFSLTRSEIRMLRGVIEIGSIRAVATAYKLSEETVKTHLKHIFEKTGTNRQADLVRLVAAMASPFRPSSAENGKQRPKLKSS